MSFPSDPHRASRSPDRGQPNVGPPTRPTSGPTSGSGAGQAGLSDPHDPHGPHDPPVDRHGPPVDGSPAVEYYPGQFHPTEYAHTINDTQLAPVNESGQPPLGPDDYATVYTGAYIDPYRDAYAGSSNAPDGDATHFAPQAADSWSQPPPHYAPPGYAPPGYTSPQHPPSAGPTTGPHYAAPGYPPPPERRAGPHFPPSDKRRLTPWIVIGVVLTLLAGVGTYLLIGRKSGSSQNPPTDSSAAINYPDAVAALDDMSIPSYVGDFYDLSPLGESSDNSDAAIDPEGSTEVSYTVPGALEPQLVVRFSNKVADGAAFGGTPKTYGDLVCGAASDPDTTICQYPLTDGSLSISLTQASGAASNNEVVPTRIQDIASLAQDYVDYALNGEPDMPAIDLAEFTPTTVPMPEKFGEWYVKTAPQMNAPESATKHAGYSANNKDVLDVMVAPASPPKEIAADLEKPQTLYGIPCGTVPSSPFLACVVALASGSYVVFGPSSSVITVESLAAATFTMVFTLKHPFES